MFKEYIFYSSSLSGRFYQSIPFGNHMLAALLALLLCMLCIYRHSPSRSHTYHCTLSEEIKGIVFGKHCTNNANEFARGR